MQIDAISMIRALWNRRRLQGLVKLRLSFNLSVGQNYIHSMQASRCVTIKGIIANARLLQAELGRLIPGCWAVMITCLGLSFTNLCRLINFRLEVEHQCGGRGNHIEVPHMLYFYHKHSSLCIKYSVMLVVRMMTSKFLKPPVHSRMACTRTCPASLQHHNHESS